MTLTAEWIEKAEEDWRVAQREFRVRKEPSLNAICFHAQQCVEKYLKACLHKSGRYFDKTHNLVKLLDQVVALVPEWAKFREELQELTAHAVEVRYPGMSADRDMAKASLTTCRMVRKAARLHLNLPEVAAARPRTPKKKQARKGKRSR
jgi:HEPN domain-containing protein